MQLFQCNKCKRQLPYADFLKNKTKAEGIAYICKECHREASRNYRKKNLEKDMLRCRLYGRNNKETERVKGKAYRQVNKKRLAQKAKERHEIDPRKRSCRYAVFSAVKRGDLVIGSCADCSKTQKETRIDAHHENYDKPLEVVWLCKSCHSIRHGSNISDKLLSRHKPTATKQAKPLLLDGECKQKSEE